VAHEEDLEKKILLTVGEGAVVLSIQNGVYSFNPETTVWVEERSLEGRKKV